ncbi:MAG TPA: hypothetical protein VES21_15980, partial [Nocardioidaceae bacterium]|nr:hypothetical protein [Nocardioidaceae bacterium]
MDPIEVRRRIDMVFQGAPAFPMSTYDNVAYGRRSRCCRSMGVVPDSIKAVGGLERDGPWVT